MSDQNLNLADHGYQDAKITPVGPHSDTVVLTNLSLQDTNVRSLQFIDGSYMASATAASGTFAPDQTADQVARLYHATLARDPDFGGVAYWKEQITSGQENLQQVANLFVGSVEFTATYRGLDNGAFVTQLYQNVLMRAPDTAGEASWVGALNSNSLTRGQVVLGFSESPEYVTALNNKGLVGSTGIHFSGGVNHA